MATRKRLIAPTPHHTYQCTTGNEYFSDEDGIIHGARHLAGHELFGPDPRDINELERMGIKFEDIEVPAEVPATEEGEQSGDEEDDDNDGNDDDKLDDDKTEQK